MQTPNLVITGNDTFIAVGQGNGGRTGPVSVGHAVIILALRYTYTGINSSLPARARSWRSASKGSLTCEVCSEIALKERMRGVPLFRGWERRGSSYLQACVARRPFCAVVPAFGGKYRKCRPFVPAQLPNQVKHSPLRPLGHRGSRSRLLMFAESQGQSVSHLVSGGFTGEQPQMDEAEHIFESAVCLQ